MKKDTNNCKLDVVQENGYEHLYITLEDGLRFQVRYAFYNRKLAYRVKKTLEK